jgi:magnesium transporter
MEARGSIVNNNMNVLLKNLTLINVVFLPLNLLASVGGMSEFTMMTGEERWFLAYPSLLVGMIALGWATYLLITRKLEKVPVATRRRTFIRSFKKKLGLTSK